ncbi:MAG: rhodanese-like domain-containing protein [Desulfatiglandaceae bacterium]
MAKTIFFFGLMVVMVLVLVPFSSLYAKNPASMARVIPPLVSTEWLEKNKDTPHLVILDVRNSQEYDAGHIPGAINSSSSQWFINPPFGEGFPWMELPKEADLFNTIGSSGITKESLVVVVGRTAGSMAAYTIADSTRVAVTLIYAGVRSVSVLDGGYNKWAEDGGHVSHEPITPAPSSYKGDVNREMFVSKSYVEGKMRKSVLVDARDADVYFGVTLEPWCKRAGHIPGAKCLPVPWFWDFSKNNEGGVIYGTYKESEILKAMVMPSVGRKKAERIIIYCGVGGYSSTMYFVLSEVLGYRNVKIYDGSAQEWTADPGTPVVKYVWE